MKELSVEDQIYLCKYHDVDESLGTTIGLNKQQAKETISKLKQKGLYEKYRNLADEEYETIIKHEKQKMENKICGILEKYNFNNTEKAFENFQVVMKKCSHYTNSAELSLEKIFREISEEKNIKSYIINNDCKKILDSTYITNKEIFDKNGYYKKPTLREFILQELKIGKCKENIYDVKENVINNITQNQVQDIDNTFVKVSVKTMMECAYYKGYLDRMLEAENKKLGGDLV